VMRARRPRSIGLRDVNLRFGMRQVQLMPTAAIFREGSLQVVNRAVTDLESPTEGRLPSRARPGRTNASVPTRHSCADGSGIGIRFWFPLRGGSCLAWMM